MTLYEFISLPDDSQYDAVWGYGVHVETLINDDIVYQLYAIDDFFVEIHYNRAENKIIGKNQFKEGEHLEKYLPLL